MPSQLIRSFLLSNCDSFGEPATLTEEDRTNLMNTVDWVNYQLGVAYTRTRKNYSIYITFNNDNYITIGWDNYPPKGLKQFSEMLARDL